MAIIHRKCYKLETSRVITVLSGNPSTPHRLPGLKKAIWSYAYDGQEARITISLVFDSKDTVRLGNVGIRRRTLRIVIPGHCILPSNFRMLHVENLQYDHSFGFRGRWSLYFSGTREIGGQPLEITFSDRTAFRFDKRTFFWIQEFDQRHAFIRQGSNSIFFHRRSASYSYANALFFRLEIQGRHDVINNGALHITNAHIGNGRENLRINEILGNQVKAIMNGHETTPRRHQHWLGWFDYVIEGPIKFMDGVVNVILVGDRTPSNC